MGSQLHQALRNLCLETGWRYAVFWRLEHGSRMLLSCVDTYYDNTDHPQLQSCPVNYSGNLQCQHLSYDLLGSAVTEMSCRTYSLGEGVVGQVAVTGKHLWISTDKCMTDSDSFFQYNEGWQTQFSAGIKTVAVVAVVPYGVIQLGSSDEIPEDLKIVQKVRDVMLGLQDSLVALLAQKILASGMDSSCLLDKSTRSLISGAYHDFSHNADRTIDICRVDFGSSSNPYTEKHAHLSNNLIIPGAYADKEIEINKFEGFGMVNLAASGNLNPLISGNDCMKQKQEQSTDVSGLKSAGEFSNHTSRMSALINGSGSSLSGSVLPVDNDSCMLSSYHSSEILDSLTGDSDRGMLSVPELSSIHVHNDYANINDATYMFSNGNELSEALGPGFRKQNAHLKCCARDMEAQNAVELSEGMGSSSLLPPNSDTEHLLEAVVASISRKEANKNDYSVLKTERALSKQNMSEPCASVGSLSSTGYSLDWETFSSLNCSSSYGMHYTKGFSSNSCSRGSESLERSQESGKIHKKRSKPGESGRPRPRDRQLIQDRIKELRELVPNGSKCSIDSLLERTIKHMTFMQSITKQAEKLSKCIGPKSLGKEPHMGGLSCTKQGSSWAVEVDNLKACPIIVENINVNGQMLVEIMCEECSHFLEIAEAIRRTGLTVLKGVTETYAEKTYFRFLVEGQNNKSLHRMDILWSLIQLLQTKVNS